jgi:hypothetical protein
MGDMVRALVMVVLVLGLSALLGCSGNPASKDAPSTKPADAPAAAFRMDENLLAPLQATQAPAPPTTAKPNPVLERKRAACVKTAVRFLDKAKKCGVDVGPRNPELVCDGLVGDSVSYDQAVDSMKFYLKDDCQTLAVLVRFNKF